MEASSGCAGGDKNRMPGNFQAFDFQAFDFRGFRGRAKPKRSRGDRKEIAMGSRRAAFGFQCTDRGYFGGI
jgi:hypothetical protein